MMGGEERKGEGNKGRKEIRRKRKGTEEEGAGRKGQGKGRERRTIRGQDDKARYSNVTS